MDRKEWNTLLDTYLSTGTMTSDGYASLNNIQQAVIQEIKKAMKRLNK